MGEAIFGIAGALGPVIFSFMYTYKPLRSSAVCPQLCRLSRCSFPRPLWDSRPRRNQAPCSSAGAGKEFLKPGQIPGEHQTCVAAWILAGSSPLKRLL